MVTQGLVPHRWPVLRGGTRQRIPLHVRIGVFTRDGWRCLICGTQGGRTTLQLDHIQPWSAGGHDGSGNLRTMCAGCNAKRSNWRYWEDDRRVVPVADGCIDCQPNDLYDGLHEYGALAFCVRCEYNSYSQMIDSCWLESCDCGQARL